MIRFFWISLILLFLTVGRQFYIELLGQLILGIALGATAAEGIRRMINGFIDRTPGRFFLALLLVAGYIVHIKVVSENANIIHSSAIILMAICGFIWWFFRILEEPTVNRNANTLPDGE